MCVTKIYRVTADIPTNTLVVQSPLLSPNDLVFIAIAYTLMIHTNIEVHSRRQRIVNE
jgi:hypothetical protein